MCPLVELNKDRPAKIKGRKSFKKDGTNLEKLFCEHHLPNDNKAEVVQTFWTVQLTRAGSVTTLHSR